MTLRTRALLIPVALFLAVPLVAQDLAAAPARPAATGHVTVAVIGTGQVPIDLGATRRMCVVPLVVVPVEKDAASLVGPLMAAARAAAAPILVQTVTVDVASGIRLGRVVRVDGADDGDHDGKGDGDGFADLERLRVTVLGPDEGYEKRTLRFSILMPSSGWRLEIARVEQNHEAVRPHLVLSRHGLGMPVLEEVHAELPIGDVELLYAASYLARIEADGDEPVFELADLLRLM